MTSAGLPCSLLHGARIHRAARAPPTCRLVESGEMRRRNAATAEGSQRFAFASRHLSRVSRSPAETGVAAPLELLKEGGSAGAGCSGALAAFSTTPAADTPPRPVPFTSATSIPVLQPTRRAAGDDFTLAPSLAGAPAAEVEAGEGGGEVLPQAERGGSSSGVTPEATVAPTTESRNRREALRLTTVLQELQSRQSAGSRSRNLACDLGRSRAPPVCRQKRRASPSFFSQRRPSLRRSIHLVRTLSEAFRVRRK